MRRERRSLKRGRRPAVPFLFATGRIFGAATRDTHARWF
ncbi:hypothetical protein BURMUCGD2M_1558 [Burkholderia multivorans CGD2M]|uniref:Uncharacterized protein n=1 Tax=Burkholderia multivorans CGD2 TaxID=513052 RepID=B9BZ08_9BURK|nr:hypothetical protein BURMUCGD2_1462 [Burkholderia multivorans CGD2]EEE14787.1 hypothetical protein BURMUCGD2M_1558 [Burkholderia multivorans CGD2M]